MQSFTRFKNEEYSPYETPDDSPPTYEISLPYQIPLLTICWQKPSLSVGLL